MNKKNIFSYLLTIFFLIIIILYFYQTQSYLLIYNSTILAYLVSSVFGFFGFLLSGYQYFLIRKKYGITLNRVDIIFFPIVQHLWGIILPFQGSVVFSILFFKYKYKMKISDSLSINIYLYIITASFTGLIGIIYSIVTNSAFSIFSFFSFILFINPLFVYLFHRILMMIPDIDGRIKKIKLWFINVLDNIKKLWQNKNFTLINFSFNLAFSFLVSFWYFWIAWNLKINIPYHALLILSLIMQLTVIIKITPANLGFAQLVSGGFSSVMGYNFSDGMIISLYATASNFLLVLTLGVYGNKKYMRDFNVSNFFTFVKNIKTTKR